MTDQQQPSQIPPTPGTPEKPLECQACAYAPGKSVNVLDINICATCEKPIKWLDEKKDVVIRNNKGQFVNGAPTLSNKNGNAGAPTKYRPEFVQAVEDYLKEATTTNKRLIGVEDFAAWLKVDDTTILNWANKTEKYFDEKKKRERIRYARPEFFAAIKRLKHYQKAQLLTDGFYGGRDVNATMAIFLLKVNHGMKEIDHVDHTTDGKPLPIQVVSYKDTK